MEPKWRLQCMKDSYTRKTRHMWESVAVFVPACLNILFLGFPVYFSSSGLVFLNFTLQWFSLHATKAQPRILQWTIKKIFLKCWKPYAYRSSLSQVTGRWKLYNMFCIFNYVIIAEMGLLLKRISQWQIKELLFFSIYFKVIVEFSFRLFWKREQWYGSVIPAGGGNNWK